MGVASPAAAHTQTPEPPPGGVITVDFDSSPNTCGTLALGLQPFEASGTHFHNVGWISDVPATVPAIAGPAYHWCVNSSSVLDDPSGGAFSVPGAIGGSMGATQSVLLQLFHSATGLPGVTQFVRVGGASGPGTDSISTNMALAAYDIDGNLLTVDGPVGSTNFAYTYLELRTDTPQIATVLMVAGAAKDVFDDLQLIPPVLPGPCAGDPVDGDGDGHPDACDNCPATPNIDQADADQDGTGDVCENTPPVADAGGPYVVVEGQWLTLDGTDSFDPDGDPLIFAWDLDGDGVFDDAVGPDQTQPVHRFDDNGAFGVTLQVTDGQATDLSLAEITVIDGAPTAEFTWDPPAPIEGTAVTFTDRSTSAPDALTAWLWDLAGLAAPDDRHPIFTFETHGDFAVTLNVTDDDGTSADQTHVVAVADGAPTADLTGDIQLNEGQPGDFNAEGSTSPADEIVEMAWDFDYDGVPLSPRTQWVRRRTMRSTPTVATRLRYASLMRMARPTSPPWQSP